MAGNDPRGGAPRNRIAQISHSVVLGTFNGGDEGEGGSADISRVGNYESNNCYWLKVRVSFESSEVNSGRSLFV